MKCIQVTIKMIGKLCLGIILIISCLTPSITSSPITSSMDIKHVIVLMLENRAFDHVFGWANKALPGVNGLTGTEFNYRNVSKLDQDSADKVYVEATAPFINQCDPDHSTPPTTQKIYSHSQALPKQHLSSGSSDPSSPLGPADMGGFVNFEFAKRGEDVSLNYCDVMTG